MLTKVLCPRCRFIMPYTIKERERIATVDDKQYSYTQKYAICDRCGSKLVAPELEDINSNAIKEAIANNNLYVEDDEEE